MCSRENWQYFQAIFILIISDDSCEAFTEMTSPFIRCFWHENPGPTSPRRRQHTNRGFLFSNSTITFLHQLMQKFRGGGRSPNQEGERERGVRSVHDNNYLCPFGFCSFHVMELFSCAAWVTAPEGWTICCWRRFVIEGLLTQPFVALRCLILFPFLLTPIPSL